MLYCVKVGDNGVVFSCSADSVKCFDNKMVKASLQLFHPFIDSASGGKPTTKKKKTSNDGIAGNGSFKWF